VGLIMATRVLATGRSVSSAWDRLVQILATWSPRDLLQRLRDFFWPATTSARERWLRLLWLPFWIGADLPAPHVRHRVTVSGDLGPASRRLVSYLAAVHRRQMLIRLMTVVARGVALGALIGVVWAGWAASGGARVDGNVLVMTTGALVILGLVFGWRQRPDLRDTAAMLDRSFDLADRMTTAFDHLPAGPGQARGKPHLTYLQIAEATNTVGMLTKHPALRVRLPIRELVLIAGLALLFLGLYLLRGTGAGLPGSGNSAVPAFVAAKDRLHQQPAVPTPPATNPSAPSVQDVQQRADQSSTAEQDLNKVADALADNPLTAPVADSIRAGDYAKASDQLNAVASQVSQLSPEARGQLADSLDQAADAMSGKHPDLQDATRDAADGLRSDPQQAESSLSDLGDEIGKTGSSVEPQDQLAKDMRDARQAESNSANSKDTRPEPGNNQGDANQGDQQIAGEGGDAASGQNQQAEQGQQTNGSGSADSNNAQQQQGDDQGQQQGQGQNQNAPGSSPPQDQRGNGADQGAGSGANGQSKLSPGDGSSSSGGNASVQGQSRPQQGDSDGSNDNAQTGSGTGAGSGTGKNQTSNGAETRPGTGSDGAPDPNVKDGNGNGSGASNGDSKTNQTHESITLSRSPDASGVQTGGASSSSAGSGSGAAAGPGSVSQGDVGSAGPDSNRVPKRYRDIVHDYFSDEP
jgi:hypothetical protein